MKHPGSEEFDQSLIHSLRHYSRAGSAIPVYIIHLSLFGARSLNQQLTIEGLEGLEDWALLPSAKFRNVDRVGVYRWAPLYTAFSERFAVAAIRLMKGAKKRPVLLDPFVGGGTSTVAAAILGVSAFGVDLDPFSALLARARVALSANPKRIASLLASTKNDVSSEFAEEGATLFRDSDLRFASSVLKRVRAVASRVPGSRSSFQALLDDSSGHFDSEVVALAALCIAASPAAKVVRGSNPVWFKKATRGEVGRTPRLDTTTHTIYQLMLEDLASLRAVVSRPPTVRLFSENFLSTSLHRGCADLILTSPPYLNRLDYVVNHIAPLIILSGLVPLQLEKLRRQMIGTTKIVEKGTANHEWGTTCNDFLQTVQKHSSIASATYYYWNYCKYFKDLYQSLQQLKFLAAPSAIGAIVIQTSFYKEVVAQTDRIVVEMAESLGVDARVGRTEIVRTHLGQISPRQTRYVPSKTLSESVVILNF